MTLTPKWTSRVVVAPSKAYRLECIRSPYQSLNHKGKKEEGKRLALMLHEDINKLQLELKDCLKCVWGDMSRFKKKSTVRARVLESIKQSSVQE
jgi:hypothetical protein